MSFTVEPVLDEQIDTAYGENHANRSLKALKITGPSGTQEIEPYMDKRVLRHSDGRLVKLPRVG